MDQSIQRTRLLGDGSEPFTNLVRVKQIQRFARMAGSLEQRQGPGESLGISAGADDSGTQAAEQNGRRLTNSRRSTRDENVAPCKGHRIVIHLAHAAALFENVAPSRLGVTPL